MTDAPVRGVCVDLDDTLFPQDEWLSGAWAAVADRAGSLGLDRDPLHRALVRIAGEGSDRGGIIDRALVATGTATEPYVAALVSVFTSHAPRLLTPYPAALAALARLHVAVPVALVTDGNPRIQRAKVAALGLASLVDHVVVSDELGGRGLRKPHPAAFEKALSLLGLPAEAVVHIGDRPAKDVAGARSVGMRCLRIRTGEYAAMADPEDLRPWKSAPSFAAGVEHLLPLLEPDRSGRTGPDSPGREQAVREQAVRDQAGREQMRPTARL